MYCAKCGHQVNENDTFCPACGAKQVTTYTMCFTRNGLSEQAFIANINQWLYENPRIANVSCHFETDTSFGFMANQYKLNQFVIEYELFEHDNQNQYFLAKEENMALYHKNVRAYMEKWKQEHPQITVVNWSGGVHSRGSTGSLLLGGIGARNRMNVYIFMKYPRQ